MLEPTAAELIARRLDHAPLALQLAQATLQERVPELRARALCGPQLAQRAAEDYLAALPEHGSATAKALTVTIDTLWRSGWVGQLAVQLARMAAFLAPGGPVLALLRSTSMLRQLGGLTDTAAPPEDLVWIDEVLRVGDRFNLFRVDWLRTSSLRIHRSISELLKEMMAPEHRAAISTAVQRGLASCAPNEAELEEASHLPRQRELHRHLLPSEALLARDPQVRRWVVKQLRYAQLYGDASAHAEALRAATLVRRRWLADPTEDVDLLPRLDEVRANLCQVLGRRQEALDLQRGVLERLRISLGSNHLRTYQASDVLGWHLRSLGRFTEANLASDTAYEGLRRVLGANHPITLRAGFNHSYILFLSGEQQRAIELGVEILERWEKQAGRGDKMTWRCAARLGKYLHHVGDDKSAAGLLDRALEAAQAERRLAGLGAQASGARWESVASPPQTDFIRAIELEIQRDLAAVRRSDGRIALAHALDKRTLRQHGEGFHDHHEMLACQLAIAADEHALGQATRAVESAKRAMAGFATLPKTHSFRYLCQLDLGVFQHSAGQRGQATTNIEQACDGLYATLGEHHPWSVAATHNRNLMRSATATRHWIVIDLP